jgi:transcriptional regulator with XRE-family HTH domain
MFRYKRLIQQSLTATDNKKAMTLRELALAIKIPVPSMHNYANFDVLPRIDNIQKMANYYGESISSLFSDEDDIEARLVTLVYQLTTERKIELVEQLENETSKMKQ